jgi:hypothetical protein
MKFFTPYLTFIVISPVLGFLEISPLPNTLMRRAECYVVSVDPVIPGLDHPCGNGYVVGNCNCCPDGRIGCLPGSVCTIVAGGSYGCATPTLQCASGLKACGPTCIATTSDCCGGGSGYCLAPRLCGAENSDGTYQCVLSGQSSTTSSTSTTKASTSVSSQTSVVLSSTTSSSHTTTTTSSIALSSHTTTTTSSIASTTTKPSTTVSGQTSVPSSSTTSSSHTTTSTSSVALGSQTTAATSSPATQTKSLGTSLQQNFWSVGGALAMVAAVLFSF